LKKVRMWDNESTERLIDEYRGHPELWDVGNPEYKNIYTKNKIWQSLAEVMGVETAEAQRKIHNLRNQWNAEHQRIALRIANGGEVRGSKWRHYNALTFIRTSLEARRNKIKMEEDLLLASSSAISSSTAAAASLSLSSLSPSVTVTHAESGVSDEAEEPEDVKPLFLHHSLECQLEIPDQSPPRKRMMSECTDGPTPYMDPRDDITIFGEYVSSELRQIQNRKAIAIAKYKINNILFEATTGVYDIK
ncbi:hypothetical protein Pcinc_039339, partial [Petrolisthes cinctipes]